MISLVLLFGGLVFFDSTVTPPTADLLSETFNTVSGSGSYDDASWTAVTDGSGVNDPNEQPPGAGACPVGTGFGSECYESFGSASNAKAYIYNDLGSRQSGPVYTVFYFYLSGFASWVGGTGKVLAGATYATCSGGTEPADTTCTYPAGPECTLGGTCTVGIPTSTSPFQATLVYDEDGITTDEITCAAPPCFRMLLRMRETGGTIARSPEVTLNTINQIKFKVDNGGQGEVWFNGTQYLATTLNNEDDTELIWVGQHEFTVGASTVYFDNVKSSSTGYVE